MHIINKIIKTHKEFWNKARVLSLIQGLIFLSIAIVIQNVANEFVSKVEGVPVGDLILSNIPTINTDIFIVQGALVLTAFVVGLLILKPRYLLFTIKAFALFIIVRSFFISLTHLGVDPHQIVFNPDRIGFGLYELLFNAKGDYFFSGHTGVPFLMASIFWKEKKLRYFFLALSVVLGVSVLLGHVHYSIDVFAAPFMTYGIYTLCRTYLKKDFALIN